MFIPLEGTLQQDEEKISVDVSLVDLVDNNMTNACRQIERTNTILLLFCKEKRTEKNYLTSFKDLQSSLSSLWHKD